VSSEVLPETAAVHWRPRIDERRLARRGRVWTLTTVAHTVPFTAAAALLFALQPLSAPLDLILLAHAWVIPELYAKRGATVLRRRPRAADGPERTALGLLGDLIGHEARELHARTGLVLERGALGVWIVGEGGALLVRARGGPAAALGRPHRAPAARAAHRRAGVRDGRQPRVQRRTLARPPPAAAGAARGAN
jgi:hypothetical protein